MRGREWTERGRLADRGSLDPPYHEQSFSMETKTSGGVPRRSAGRRVQRGRQWSRHGKLSRETAGNGHRRGSWVSDLNKEQALRYAQVEALAGVREPACFFVAGKDCNIVRVLIGDQ